MRESRLELDDDGRVLDAPAEPLDLVADTEPRHRLRLPRGTGIVALALLVALGAWFALRPPPEPPLAASVDGVGIAPASGLDDPLVALYRVDPSEPRTSVEVLGLVGPGVRASTAYADPAAQGVRIAVVPDCDAAPTSGGSYAVDLAVTNDAGATAQGLLPLADGPVDWSAAIEDRCWRRATSAGLSLVSVRAAPDIGRGLVSVQAVLRNSTGRDLSLRALDVADIANIETAPVSDLPATGQTEVQARVSGRCGTAGSPPSLSWAVGPAGAASPLTLITPLAPADQREIARAMGVLCSSPPPTTVTVESVRAVPGDPQVTWVGGAVVEVRLRVSTAAASIGLGSDPTGATADGRRSFSYETVAGPVQDAEVTVRWNVPCVVAPDRSLPVLARTQRLAFASSVQLTGGVVDTAVSEACGLGP